MSTGYRTAARLGFRSMATDVTFHVEHPTPDAAQALEEAREVFARVESACTRFDDASSLMRANAHPRRWTTVAPECFDGVVAAADAYCMTGGVFDPRVLADLRALGYDRSFAAGSPARVSRPATRERAPLGAWRPGFRRDTQQIRLGDHAVDLGGIGKGLAVRWAAARLRRVSAHFLVEAGGDCYCAGSPAEGGPWRIWVEDPRGTAPTTDTGDTAAEPEPPIAVLGLTDRAVATSSVRFRRWRQGTADVHHLIDPVDGRPGGAGLQAVTVVGADCAIAEVWSKTLFLAGAAHIRAEAAARGLAALWVDDAGTLHLSDAIRPYVLWTAS